jgi:hypothetical protein
MVGLLQVLGTNGLSHWGNNARHEQNVVRFGAMQLALDQQGKF